MCVCNRCEDEFGLLNRKHHCRKCGGVFCDSCTAHKVCIASTSESARVCKHCYYSILSHSKFITSLPVSPTAPLDVPCRDSDSGMDAPIHVRVSQAGGDSDDEDEEEEEDKEEDVRPSIAADDTPCIIS